MGDYRRKNSEIRELYKHAEVVAIGKNRRMQWTGLMLRTEAKMTKIFRGKSEERSPRRPKLWYGPPYQLWFGYGGPN